ncbi:hypothetical protein ACFX2C_030036 [Malus domestica]
MVFLEANLYNLWRLCRPFRFEEMWTHHEECEEARWREIDIVHDQITVINSHPYSNASISERYDLSHHLDSLLIAKESYWKQQQQKNKIKGLVDIKGTWQSESWGIENVILDYFKSMFCSQSGGRNLDATVIDALNTKLTHEMNVALCRAFTQEQVKIALFQMHPFKSPSSDEMPSYFAKNIGLFCAISDNSILVSKIANSLFKHLKG